MNHSIGFDSVMELEMAPQLNSICRNKKTLGTISPIVTFASQLTANYYLPIPTSQSLSLPLITIAAHEILTPHPSSHTRNPLSFSHFTDVHSSTTRSSVIERSPKGIAASRTYLQSPSAGKDT